MKYSLLAAQRTDQGKVRKNNQDSLGCLQVGGTNLFVIADGLGGLKHGEVASREAVDEVKALLKTDISADPKRWLEQTIRSVNSKIYGYNQPLHHSEWMATTLTVSVFGTEHLFIGHVGDCRVYQLRDGRMRRLTTDHSMDRNVLTRAIGTEGLVEADIYTSDLKIGDIYVQCSDGLYAMAYDYQIAETVRDFSPHQSCERLVKLANQHGGIDNISIQVISIVSA